MSEPYGMECIIDVHDCQRFTRSGIEYLCQRLCKILDMEREDLFFWDYEGEPEEYRKAPAHLKGISAVQFIKTSNITVHALDELKRLYLNIFSCKRFDPEKVKNLVISLVGGRIVNFTVLTRI